MTGESGQPLPSGESGVELQRVEPRLFGLVSPFWLLSAGGLLLLVAVALLAVGHFVVGPLLLVLALVMLGLYITAARHLPASRVSRRAVGGIWRARDELRLAGSAAGAWTRAGWRVFGLERELRRLGRERQALQHALGAAAYRGDESEAEALKQRLGSLDERVAECTRGIEDARSGAEQRVSQARRPLGRTEVLRPRR